MARPVSYTHLNKEMERQSKKIIAILLSMLMVFSVCSPITGGAGLGSTSAKAGACLLYTSTKEQIKNVYENAGLFYQLAGRPLQALEMYEKADSMERMVSILIRLRSTDCLRSN